MGSSIVGALLQWQENYRQHIESLVSQFELALVGVEKSRIAIEDISKNTSSIPSTMENLSDLLKKLDQEVEKAQELLRGFAALRTQADDVFPVIQRSLDQLTQEMTQSVTASTRQVETIITNQSHSLEALAKQISEQVINADNIMRKGLEDIRGMFKKTLDDVEASTKKHYESLDKQMEAELERAIKLLGSKLASVSGKLIEDHSALTGKISDLVLRATQNEKERF